MSDSLAWQLRQRGIYDERVLEVISSLSRADFVPEELSEQSEGDYPLPIGFGQTISQPYIVAYMTQALGLRGDEKVLEIGTGSAYQTAILALLADQVFSVEIVEPLARAAAERISALALRNVHLRHGDGNAGWPEAAPFDAILLTAAPPRLPQALLAQLSPGGRLVAPLGADETGQELVRVKKDAYGRLSVERLLAVRFVPMTGQDGAAV